MVISGSWVRKKNNIFSLKSSFMILVLFFARSRKCVLYKRVRLPGVSGVELR